jgi:hypothetical protein
VDVRQRFLSEENGTRASFSSLHTSRIEAQA